MDCIRTAGYNTSGHERGLPKEKFGAERLSSQCPANVALSVPGFAPRRPGHLGIVSSIPPILRPAPLVAKGMKCGLGTRSLEEIRLEGSLSKRLGAHKTLKLRLTSNRHTIVSVKRGPGVYDVRVHQMFSHADEKVVSALSRYVVSNDSDAARFLGKFIDGHRQQIEAQPKRSRRIAIRTDGQHHDLGAIFKRLNDQYFSQPIRARITWGMAARRSQRRSIMVGSYSVEDRLIRVHPLLDRAEVPAFFVEWIVYHEMLHAKHPIRKVGGRRCFHPPAFLDEERCFIQWEQAQRWQRENLDRLLNG